MQNIVLIGAGKGGSALLELLRDAGKFTFTAVIDKNPSAPGLRLAEQMNIPIANDWRSYISASVDVIIDASGDDTLLPELLDARDRSTVVIPGEIASILVQLIEDNKETYQQIDAARSIQRLIFDSMEEGIISIDQNGYITSFNESAARITQVDRKQVIGRPVHEIIPDSRLPQVASFGRSEINQQLTLESGTKIVTSRHPIITEAGERIGAFAVFQDISELQQMAEEITNLREVQMMLEAIIQSSDDAISVVDEKGIGLLINPAYTRITGLKEEDIIGRPAEADIADGESIHRQVLDTRKPVRGKQLQVGKDRKDVIVNVAPVIVNNRLKGSVGVIHDVTEIRSMMKELDRARLLIRSLESNLSFDDIVGVSEKIQFAKDQAKLAAGVPVTVFLRGETGVGKDLFAHAIHRKSERKHNKFIRVNCSSEEARDQLFTSSDKLSLAEQAINGTLFLDEIGELTLSQQQHLLDLLSYQKLPSRNELVDLRIIASTSEPLEKNMRDGLFLEELYFQINKMPIFIPPLRERTEDIPIILDHLLVKLNKEYGRQIAGFSDKAIQALKQYDWPGNVRELENVVSRTMIFMNASELKVEEKHLPLTTIRGKQPELPDGSLSDLVESYERQLIQQTLTAYKGNKAATAKKLNVSLRTLYYKIEKLGIEE
ncbi:sigma 54-interacting transcriptional regulator [Chryseomicrobium palamuruense]|uniref:Sigma 54-interacting transcriptional regulator n=1 Tax=Chryseomicrobium palamuruense TaxID=682973 RepID=A0ABV8UZM1_9BACL